MDSFIVFRKPNEEKINFQKLKLINEDSENQFIIHSFNNAIDWKFAIEDSEIVTSNTLKNISFSLPKSSVHTPELSKEQYLELCNQFIEELKRNTFNKLIISRVKRIEALDPLSKFKELLDKYPQAFVYLFQHENHTWIGATPERLLKIENELLQTVALAGTKKASENRDWTGKEYAEHQYVVEYIKDCLAEFNPKIEKTKTITLKNIQHLKTNISAKISQKNSIDEIVRRLHPTPAVCGLPKEKAMQYILKNEPHQRYFYSGYLGHKRKDFVDVYVNLRCAQLFKEHTLLYIGGGVTSESNSINEWNETELKATALV